MDSGSAGTETTSGLSRLTASEFTFYGPIFDFANGNLLARLLSVRETPEPLTYREYLPALYRFAYLMTGTVPTAAEVLRLTVEQAERGDLSDVRDPRRVKRWLFARARTLCARPLVLPEALPGAAPPDGTPALPELADDPGRQLIALFAPLPEAERSALTLFYLYLFTPAELAEVLDVKAAELSTLLNRGRASLQRQRGAGENLLTNLGAGRQHAEVG